MDAQTVNNAVQILRQSLGEQIEGDQQSGIVAMRQALAQNMNISEDQADILVTQLAQTSQIVYHPNQGAPDMDVEELGIPIGIPSAGMPLGAVGSTSGNGILTAIPGITPAPGTSEGTDAPTPRAGRGYWAIPDATAVGNDTAQATSVEGDDYEGSGVDDSYNSDLRHAGQNPD